MSNAGEVVSADTATDDPPDYTVDLEPPRFGGAGALLALLGSLYLALNEVSVLSGKFVLESGAAEDCQTTSLTCRRSLARTLRKL